MRIHMRLLLRRFFSQSFQFSLMAVLLIHAGYSGDLAAQSPSQPAPVAKRLELSRAARPWEFLAAVGKRAGLLGNEAGRVEAWTYPLKLLRDLRLTILTEGREIPAETLVRTVIARPESTTLVFTGDTFTVRETFFVPVDQPGAVIEIVVETEKPLELKASFIRDFQLEWPASMGGTYISWSDALHGFIFGEDQQRFAALIGSPTAGEPQLEYETNYGGTHTSSMKLGVTAKGRDTRIIVLSGSVNGRTEAEKTYRLLSSDYQKLWRESADFYTNYLLRTTTINVPDADIQNAYDWSRVSLIQGLVSNPTMGDGLIAGYRTSGEAYRPGFAWFFGRDALWSSLALNSEGDFVTTKTALQFIAKFQREDGKIPHEIAQGASFVDWFKGYPYAFASADATPLYVIATDDYITASGDIEFAKANWPSISKAYEFVRSTYNANGFPKNFGIGHGWVEGGPLLPIESEFYQSGSAVAAIRAMAHLSQLTGKDAEAKSLEQQFAKERKQLNDAFWSPEKTSFAFAIDRDNKRVDEPTVLSTVPMWLGLTDEDRSQQTIAELSKPEHETDWGMRIISNRAPKYSGGGYHYGSVWPLFTGWASVGEYKYHKSQPAYDNLRANALLALDGSPGHVTEVLSGDYYQPLSTSSPHQIWSAAMVISPLLRGMFGLEPNAVNRVLTVSPHLPANWARFSLANIRVGEDALWLNYTQTEGAIVLEAARTQGQDDCTLEFRPAMSLRARILKVDLNGKPIPFHLEPHDTDQHVIVRIPIRDHNNNVLRISVADDFAISIDSTLPALGAASQGMRIISETWSSAKDQLTLKLVGEAGREYRLNVSNPGQIERLEGTGVNLISHMDAAFVTIQFRPSDSDVDQNAEIVFRFKTKRIKR
jgi:GH15 family glucan-1,4-alpha-glucosidase